MATDRKRGSRHQAIVCINGVAEICCVDTEGEAKAWAEARERLITNATDEFMLEGINYLVGAQSTAT
jgi:hypothetical protein